MAYIRAFRPKASYKKLKIHPTETVVTYRSDYLEEKKIFEFSSTDSESRENPGKESQTYQLNEEKARELYSILAREFGF